MSLHPCPDIIIIQSESHCEICHRKEAQKKHLQEISQSVLSRVLVSVEYIFPRSKQSERHLKKLRDENGNAAREISHLDNIVSKYTLNIPFVIAIKAPWLHDYGLTIFSDLIMDKLMVTIFVSWAVFLNVVSLHFENHGKKSIIYKNQ